MKTSIKIGNSYLAQCASFVAMFYEGYDKKQTRGSSKSGIRVVTGRWGP